MNPGPPVISFSMFIPCNSYHFLIYNASVLMWKICHHFQRPGYYRYFAKPLRVVVKALDTTTQDHSWKLDLLMY